MYTDGFPVYVKDWLQRVNGIFPVVGGDVSVFANNVKLRASSPAVLQGILDVPSLCESDQGMTWSIHKCDVIKTENGMLAYSYKIAGSSIEVIESATYLGVSLRHDTVGVEENCKAIRSACKRINLLHAVGFHGRSPSSLELLNICRTYVYPLPDYAMHIVPTPGSLGYGHREFLEALNELDHRVAGYSLGCIHKEPMIFRLSDVLVGGCRPPHSKVAMLKFYDHMLTRFHTCKSKST